MKAQDGWSTPDSEGIRTLTIGFGAKASLRGQRVRRRDTPNPQAVEHWPQEWRDLLTKWLKSESDRVRWITLLGIAGPQGIPAANELLRALLVEGFVEVDERRENGRWAPAWVRFINSALLKPRLGLTDAEALAREFDELKLHRVSARALSAAWADAGTRANPIALRRLRLLQSLDSWIHSGRRGTRRDFALFSHGDTKAIPDADWDWLERFVDFENAQIERHIPLMLIRAPVRLVGGAELDLKGIEDCIGISPSLVARLTQVVGSIQNWLVIENRTLFDCLAREYGGIDAVVWAPGFPPIWWCEAMKTLLIKLPAPVRIACDPDPAGIQIAVQLGSLCGRIGVKWAAWGMDVEALESLPAHRMLTEEDMKVLGRLQAEGLPEPLQSAALWMQRHGLKGEQEGLSAYLMRKSAPPRTASTAPPIPTRS